MKRLLFHCQHSLGLGHLVRSLALARSLAERFDVVLLVGGEWPGGIDPPAELEIVQLPALSLPRRRAELVLGTLRRVQPEVVVVELFPFGRKQLAGELLPLLHEGRATGALLACSLRDILVRGRSDQAAHDERAARTANRLLDVVLVHADPRLVRLEETFRPRTPLRVPVRYTGFVVSDCARPRSPASRFGPLVVSAGGGRFGGPLLRAALAAQPLIRARTGMPVRLVAGPFLPEDEWRALQRETHGREGIELVRVARELPAELALARASLSQCGYNTALDLLRTGVPALVAPFAAPGEDEQTRRAALLAQAGAVRVLADEELAPDELSEAVNATIRRPAADELDLDFDGASRTRELLERAVAARSRAA